MIENTTSYLNDLIGRNLEGATLIDYKITRVLPEQTDYVVIWQDEKQFGTHVAQVSTDGSLSDLVWGEVFHACLGECTRTCNCQFQTQR